MKNQKSVQISVPEGFEIDKENSSFEYIVFKPLLKSVIERIGGLEDAIKDLGDNDEDVKQLKLLYSVKGLSRKIIAHQEIIVMVKALNEDWVPDFEDGNWNKHFIWWKWVNGELQFNFVHCYLSCAITSSRLCLKTKELALHLKDIAYNQFKEYM